MSPGDEEVVLACDLCGATIYPEHLARHTAERIAGKLHCAHCLADARQSPAGPIAAAAGQTPRAGGAASGDMLTFDLAGTDDMPAGANAGGTSSAAQTPGLSPSASGGAPTARIQHNEARAKTRTYHRPLRPDSPHATRCKIFHCKLQDASITNLYEQINEWADAQPDIVIKFATSSVGVLEGKHPDPHLFVTVFY